MKTPTTSIHNLNTNEFTCEHCNCSHSLEEIVSFKLNEFGFKLVSENIEDFIQEANIFAEDTGEEISDKILDFVNNNFIQKPCHCTHSLEEIVAYKLEDLDLELEFESIADFIKESDISIEDTDEEMTHKIFNTVSAENYSNGLDQAINNYIVDLENEKDFDLTEEEYKAAVIHFLFSIRLERPTNLMRYTELFEYL